MIRLSTRDKKLLELLAKYEVMSSKQIRSLVFSQIPETNFFRRLRQLDSEIESKSKRVQNLVSRIAELPSEISADAFYQQIKETNQKIIEFKSARTELMSKSLSLKGNAIHKDGLIDKIKRTIAKLEETPIELRKPLYSNLIKFAEIHPTKIKVGVYAPTESFNFDDQNPLKATGTDGVPRGAELNFKNSEVKTKILDFSRKSAGSTSVTFGAR